MSKQTEAFSSAVTSLIEGMNGYLSTKTVVGEPVYLEDTIILPLVGVSFGMAANAFAGEKKDDSGGGIGGKMTPQAVIVLHNGKTRLINIATHNGIEKLLDMVPDFVDSFRNRGKDRDEDEKEAREAAADSIRETVVDASEV